MAPIQTNNGTLAEGPTTLQIADNTFVTLSPEGAARISRLTSALSPFYEDRIKLNASGIGAIISVDNRMPGSPLGQQVHLQYQSPIDGKIEITTQVTAFNITRPNEYLHAPVSINNNRIFYNPNYGINMAFTDIKYQKAWNLQDMQRYKYNNEIQLNNMHSAVIYKGISDPTKTLAIEPINVKIAPGIDRNISVISTFQGPNLINRSISNPLNDNKVHCGFSTLNDGLRPGFLKIAENIPNRTTYDLKNDLYIIDNRLNLKPRLLNLPQNTLQASLSGPRLASTTIKISSIAIQTNNGLMAPNNQYPQLKNIFLPPQIDKLADNNPQTRLNPLLNFTNQATNKKSTLSSIDNEINCVSNYNDLRTINPLGITQSLSTKQTHKPLTLASNTSDEDLAYAAFENLLAKNNHPARLHDFPITPKGYIFLPTQNLNNHSDSRGFVRHDPRGFTSITQDSKYVVIGNEVYRIDHKEISVMKCHAGQSYDQESENRVLVGRFVKSYDSYQDDNTPTRANQQFNLLTNDADYRTNSNSSDSFTSKYEKDLREFLRSLDQQPNFNSKRTADNTTHINITPNNIVPPMSISPSEVTITAKVSSTEWFKESQRQTMGLTNTSNIINEQRLAAQPLQNQIENKTNIQSSYTKQESTNKFQNINNLNYEKNIEPEKNNIFSDDRNNTILNKIKTDQPENTKKLQEKNSYNTNNLKEPDLDIAAAKATRDALISATKATFGPKLEYAKQMVSTAAQYTEKGLAVAANTANKIDTAYKAAKQREADIAAAKATRDALVNAATPYIQTIKNEASKLYDDIKYTTQKSLIIGKRKVNDIITSYKKNEEQKIKITDIPDHIKNFTPTKQESNFLFNEINLDIPDLDIPLPQTKVDVVLPELKRPTYAPDITITEIPRHVKEFNTPDYDKSISLPEIEFNIPRAEIP
ncbi:MAG: hypothetical protein PHZ27_05910, partial [Candidatus Omnitrophica bacterium]|nr:hypothetical protein [Candidatus Omnitrophota bacterium]